MSQHIDTLILKNFGDGIVEIYEEKDENDTWFDLYDSAGSCLNEGEPFWDVPSLVEVEDFMFPKDD